MLRTSPSPQTILTANGDTFLHVAIKYCMNVNELLHFVKRLDTDDVLRMAKISNNQGKLPYEYIGELIINDHDWHLMMDMIIPYTLEKFLKPMSERVEYKEIKKMYGTAHKSELNGYLKLGCFAVNKTRKLYRYSSTHPENNHKSNNFITTVNDEITSLRMQRKENGQLIKSEIPKKNNKKVRKELFERLLANQVANDNKGYGNCYEQAYTVYDNIKQKDKRVSAAIYKVNRGDHAFVILDPQGYKILVDAWLGIICTGDYIASQLRTHKGITYTSELATEAMNYNFLGSFNPVHHSVIPVQLFLFYPQVINKKLCEYPISLKKIESKPLDLPLEEQHISTCITDNAQLHPFKRDMIDLLISADIAAHLFILTTSTGLEMLSDSAVCKAIQSDVLNNAVKGETPIYNLSSTIDGIKILLKNYMILPKISANGLNACNETGQNVLMNLASNTYGCILLFRNKRLRNLIAEQGLFSITKNDGSDVKGKCPADFLILPANSQLFKKLNVEIQKCLLDYKNSLQKHANLLFFPSRSEYSEGNVIQNEIKVKHD